MRLRKTAIALGLVLLASSSVAQTDTQPRIERAITAFEDWLDKQGTTGAFALVRNGETVLSHGAGRDASAPVELASLSKTITGICAAELVDQGVMAWSDTLRETLGSEYDITLAQLLAHGSGLVSNLTQTPMADWLDDQTKDRSRDVLDLVIQDGGPKGEVGRYAYVNENFALAGLMIEAATGREYSDVCTQFAIAPAGVSAQASPRAGAFLPWGGWQMTVADHALWHAHWFASDTDIANDPKALPYAEIDTGLYYGAGVTFRTMTRGNTFWHFGALCFPGRLNTGSYVATVFADWTVMASWDACVDWNAMFALDGALTGALYRDLP